MTLRKDTTTSFTEGDLLVVLRERSSNSDELIGDLPVNWNWMAIEYPENPNVKLIHYTLGTPCFSDYANESMSDSWHIIYSRANEGFS